MEHWVVGVDLGATKVGLGLVDAQNRVTLQRRFSTQEAGGVQGVIDRIAVIFGEYKDSLPLGNTIEGLGICSPGPLNHETGIIVDPPNLPEWRNVPMKRLLMDKLGVPVVLEHDAKASALGEFHYGAGRGAQSMIYIVIGTGVGGAIILNGQLYRGANNSSGEIGHITIDLHGEPCSCGSKGCAETFLSGPNLARMYCRKLPADTLPAFCKVSLDEVTGEIVTRLASQGDKLALKVMDEAGEALGALVASLAMTLDIDVFVIGSSVAKAGDLLLKPAHKAVPHYSFRSVSSRVKILKNVLGDEGPLLGCAWLVRQHIQSMK